MICKICDTQVFGNICYNCANEVVAPPPAGLSETQQIVEDLRRARSEHVEWGPETRKIYKRYAHLYWDEEHFGPPKEWLVYEQNIRTGKTRFLGYE